MLIIWFVIFSIIILFLARSISTHLDIIAKKTRLSSGFVGGVMLSIVTSIPEMITAIYNGIKPDVGDGMSTIIGANSITTFTLAITSLSLMAFLAIKGRKLNVKSKLQGVFFDISNENKFLIRASFLINSILVLSLVVLPLSRYLFIPGIKISLFSFIPLVLYIYYCFKSYRKNSGEITHIIEDRDQKSVKKEITKSFALFALFSLFIVFCAYMNAAIANLFPERFGLSKNTSSGLLLAISGALPEISTCIFLIYKRQTTIAVAGIVGSHLFNLVLIFLTDAISYSSGNGSLDFITHQIWDQKNRDYIVIIPWAVTGLLCSGFLTMQTLNIIKKRTINSIVISIAIVVSYITGYFVTNLAF